MMDSLSRKPQSKHHKPCNQRGHVERPNCPGLREHVTPGKVERPEEFVASEAMDIDSPLFPKCHGKEEVEASYDKEGLRELRRPISGFDRQAPDVHLKIPHKTSAYVQSSERKDLLKNPLEDKFELKSQLAEAERRAADAEKRAADAERQIGQSRWSLFKYFYPLDDRDLQLRHFKENEPKLHTRIKELLIKLEELETWVQYLKEENRGWTEKATQYETDIKQIQMKSIKEMSDGRWNPVPDQDIHNNLHVLHGDIRLWAQKWASGSAWLHSLPPDTRTDSVLSFLNHFVQRDSSGALPKVVANPGPKLKDRMPGLLLSAALAELIRHQFFDNPFFCVDEKHARALKETHMDLIKANPREAHIWRSTLWRIMNQPGVNQSGHETFKRVRNLCNQIGSEFKKGPAEYLLRSDEPEDARNERAKSLRDILEKAAKIATSLWVQRSFLRSIGLHDFIQKNIPFSVESPIMESHRLNKVDIDDKTHNGCRILVVVRPALLAFEEDDTQGLGGDRYRVLAKAIVFLDN